MLSFFRDGVVSRNTGNSPGRLIDEQDATMTRALLLAIPFMMMNGAVLAAQSNGNAALALAAIVGERSPALRPNDKMVLARFLAGETSFTLPPGIHQIVVK